METKLNAWTLDTIYDPLTGGEMATYEPKTLMQKTTHNRSMKVLPSTINHSKETFNIVSGHQVSDVRRVVTMAMKKDELNKHFAKRSTVSKYTNIVSNHNLSPDYQRIAAANSVVDKRSATGVNQIPVKTTPGKTNTFMDTESRVTAFNRKRLIT